VYDQSLTRLRPPYLSPTSVPMQLQLPSKPRTSTSMDRDGSTRISGIISSSAGIQHRAMTTLGRPLQDYERVKSFQSSRVTKLVVYAPNKRPWLLPHRKGNTAATASQAPKEEQKRRVTLACMHRYRRMGPVNQTISGQGLFREARQGKARGVFLWEGKVFLFCSGLKLGMDEGRLDHFFHLSGFPGL
jgi:hypothetical protein